MKKKILLISRSLYNPENFEENSIDIYQDSAGIIGAEVIKYFLKKSSPEYEIYCLETRSTNSITRILEIVDDYSPDLIGMSLYAWNTNFLMELNDKLKNYPVFLGGTNTYFFNGNYLPKNVIFAVLGEGEEVTPRLVNEFFETGKVSDTKGILTQTQVESSPICFEDWDKDENSYIEGVLKGKNLGIQQITWELSRGCCYSCNYCIWSKIGKGKRIKALSIERIEKEFRCFLDNKIYNFYIVDATFNYDVERAKKIISLLYSVSKEYNVVNEINFLFEVRAEHIDEEFLALCSKIPGITFEIGLQSLNQETLSVINRYFNKEKFKKGIDLCNKYNIHYSVDLICMLPMETSNSFIEGIKYCINDIGVKVLSINRLHIYKGMGLWDMREKFYKKYELDNKGELLYIDESSTISKEDLDFIIKPFIQKLMIEGLKFNDKLNKISYLFTHTDDDGLIASWHLDNNQNLVTNQSAVNWGYIINCDKLKENGIVE